jgi:hypothetical protein
MAEMMKNKCALNTLLAQQYISCICCGVLFWQNHIHCLSTRSQVVNDAFRNITHRDAIGQPICMRCRTYLLKGEMPDNCYLNNLSFFQAKCPPELAALSTIERAIVYPVHCGVNIRAVRFGQLLREKQTIFLQNDQSEILQQLQQNGFLLADKVTAQLTKKHIPEEFSLDRVIADFKYICNNNKLFKDTQFSETIKSLSQLHMHDQKLASCSSSSSLFPSSSIAGTSASSQSVNPHSAGMQCHAN